MKNAKDQILQALESVVKPLSDLVDAELGVTKSNDLAKEMRKVRTIAVQKRRAYFFHLGCKEDESLPIERIEVLGCPGSSATAMDAAKMLYSFRHQCWTGQVSAYEIDDELGAVGVMENEVPEQIQDAAPYMKLDGLPQSGFFVRGTHYIEDVTEHYRPGKPAWLSAWHSSQDESTQPAHARTEAQSGEPEDLKDDPKQEPKQGPTDENPFAVPHNTGGLPVKSAVCLITIKDTGGKVAESVTRVVRITGTRYEHAANHAAELLTGLYWSGRSGESPQAEVKIFEEIPVVNAHIAQPIQTLGKLECDAMGIDWPEGLIEYQV